MSRKYKIEMKNRKNDELSELVMWYTVMNKGFIDDNCMLQEFLIEKVIYKCDDLEKEFTFIKDKTFTNIDFRIDKHNFREKFSKNGNMFDRQQDQLQVVKDLIKPLLKTQSTYLIVMQIFDILLFETVKSLSNSKQVTISDNYSIIKEMTDKKVEIGAGIFSDDSFFLKKDFYMKNNAHNITNFYSFNNEYEYKVYKVTTSSSGSNRYNLATRGKVINWAQSKLGRPYDKGFSNNKKFTSSEDEKYNCSELVWKAWKSEVGLDLDSNGGLGVYPNNITNSSRTKYVTKG